MKTFQISSKWSYLMSGFNAAFALVGAICGSATLMFIGVGFGIWNFWIAEYNKGVEDEAIRIAARSGEQSVTEDKE